MEIQIATLCDAATDYNGKLNILGAFDTIAAGKLPAPVPQCAMAIRMQFEREDAGEHDLVVSVIDPDGTPVVKPLEMSFGLEWPPEDDVTFLTRNLVYYMHNLQFPSSGQHSLDIRCDGDILARRPISVIVRDGLPTPPPAQQAPDAPAN